MQNVGGYQNFRRVALDLVRYWRDLAEGTSVRSVGGLYCPKPGIARLVGRAGPTRINFGVEKGVTARMLGRPTRYAFGRAAQSPPTETAASGRIHHPSAPPP